MDTLGLLWGVVVVSGRTAEAAGGKRLLQRVDGYKHTIVSGVETYRDGVPTGELPGRLVRS